MTSSPPSDPTGGGGNYQQSQQSYSWIDGNTQDQHHRSQQSWSWQGQVQAQTVSPVDLQSPPPVLPPLLQDLDSHHLLHQQMHQNATRHFQQVQALQQQQIAGMQRNMSGFALGSVTPMMMQTQQQQQVQGLLAPAIPTATVQPLEHGQQYRLQKQPDTASQQAQNTPQGSQPPSEASTQRLLQPRPNEQLSQTAIPASDSPRDDRLANLEKQRKADVENTNRVGAEISRRIRDLEQSGIRAQQDHDAKDREVRRLQEQLTSVERQRRQDAERNSQQLADLVRSRVTSPAASTGAFAMDALQKVVRETQAHQLTAEDIERVIEEEISKRLVGMATKQDIQNARAQLHGALSKVPVGLSQHEVQQAVSKELNAVMWDVANRVDQQMRVGGQGQPGTQSWFPSQDCVRTEFVVESLPNDAIAIRLERARQHGGRTQRQPLPAEMSGLTAAAGPSTPTQCALSSAPKMKALGAPPSTMSHSAAISQRPATPARIQARITAPYAAPGPVLPTVVADSSLVTSRRSSPVMNTASRGPRFRTLQGPPLLPDVSENALARVESSAPRATLPSSDVLPTQNRQRMEVPAAQRQIATMPAATRQEVLQ